MEFVLVLVLVSVSVSVSISVSISISISSIISVIYVVSLFCLNDAVHLRPAAACGDSSGGVRAVEAKRAMSEH